MNKHVFTYVVSKNICWSDMVVELLSAIHKQYSFKIEQSVDSLWELPSNSIVIYDKDSIGNPASLLITPAERGGEWLIVNGKPEDEECVAGFISLGFSGLIVSPYTLEILPRALRNISNGQLWFSREAMSGALRHLVRGGGLSSPSVNVIGAKYSLSTREQQIFQQLLQGRSNKDIAEQFYLSVSTVKCHVSSILLKTGQKSRSQLSALLMESD